MKKTLALLLALLLCLTVSGAGCGETGQGPFPEDLPDITFFGAVFGSRAEEVRKCLGMEPCITLTEGLPVLIEDICALGRDYDRAYSNDIRGRFRYGLIDGYTFGDSPARVILFFVLPLVDGVPARDNDALFYAAALQFIESNDPDNLLNCLAENLSAKYGEAENGAWQGNGGVTVSLRANAGAVNLSYVWHGAEEIIEEVFDSSPLLDTGGFTDKMLTCRDCGVHFLFSAYSQLFYQTQGFQGEPGRCLYCRNIVKFRNTKAERKWYDAVCSGCGKQIQLVFEPDGSTPVYCQDCFTKRRESLGY